MNKTLGNRSECVKNGWDWERDPGRTCAKGRLLNPVFVFHSETRSRDRQTLRVVDRRVLGRDRRAENGSDIGSAGDVGLRCVDRG